MTRHMRQMRISKKKDAVARSMPKEPNDEYWVCRAGGAHHWRLDALTDSTGHIHGKCIKCGEESNRFTGGYPDVEFPRPKPIEVDRDVLDS